MCLQSTQFFNDSRRYRLEPDRTLATRRLAGRKVNKERLSIALCASADDLHKLKPLVIGKYQKPRCFKNINIGRIAMQYRNNSKAWMTINLFQDWLQEFDREMAEGTAASASCFCSTTARAISLTVCLFNKSTSSSCHRTQRPRFSLWTLES